jgi:hypothetical protein
MASADYSIFESEKKSAMSLRRIQNLLLVLILLSLTPVWSMAQKTQSQPGYLKLTIFRYKNDTQEKQLDEYLSHALIPALHRMKIGPVGVFSNITNDTATIKSKYVLISLPSLGVMETVDRKLANDKTLQANGAEYIDASYKTPAYDRMEVILLRSFSLAPRLEIPKLKSAKDERVYELRSYEGPTEKFFLNKVHMFNQGGEVGIFRRLNFNAAFYGEVLAGARMPNLMYMTCFENNSDREAHWKAFGSDPEWKTLSAMPEYKNNVSRSEKILLRPAAYSDL